MSLIVLSPAFSHGQPIPRRYTCDGEDVSPPLAWRGQPAGTRSFAVICEDPDAPAGLFTHWVLYDLPASLEGLREGVRGIGRDGVNSFGRAGYGGPCPPPGAPHRYYFRVYALDAPSIGGPGLSRDEALAAMRGHVLAEGETMGTYGRSRR